MLLVINDYKTIGDLQEHFNKCFPNLKIEFYYHPRKEIIDASRKIGDVSRKHQQDMLEIKSWDKTGKVVHDLRMLFGLNARIFRHENGAWVAASQHDPLSLGEEQAKVPYNLSGENNYESQQDEEGLDYMLPR